MSDKASVPSSSFPHRLLVGRAEGENISNAIYVTFHSFLAWISDQVRKDNSTVNAAFPTTSVSRS